MLCWIITFFLGVCALLIFSTLPNLLWLLSLIPVFLLWFFSPTKIKKIVFQLLVFGLGFFWALVYVSWVFTWKLPVELEGKTISIIGHIVAVPSCKNHNMSFIFKAIIIDSKKVNTKLKIKWYGEYPEIKVGDKWLLKVRLKRPHGLLNPGGFDFEKYLFINHIRATGYVVVSEDNKLLSSSIYKYPFERLRQILSSKIDEVLNGADVASIIIALSTGDTNRISFSQWQVLRNTGTSHLIAISGLHIGLVAGVVYFLVQFLWKLSRRLPLFFPARKVGIVLGFIFGLLYAILSGFSIPAERAVVMLFVFSVIAFFDRSSRAWQDLLYSLLIVLIINPLSILSAGFWLSFGAVTAIIYVVSNRVKPNVGRVYKFWQLQLTVTFFLLPFTLFFFQQTSLMSIPANIIAMPIICLLVVPIALLGSLGLLVSNTFGHWILLLDTKLLEVVWYWLKFLADLQICNWHHSIYNIWILVVVLVGCFVLFAPLGFLPRALGFFYFIPLFFYYPARPSDNEFWFTTLDVGQGLACIIQTKNHVLLYDTGPKILDFDAGSNVILPYFKHQGIKSIDRMMISHGDNDHIGGAFSIIKSFPVNDIYTSVPDKFKFSKIKKCRAGQKWDWDGVSFQVVSPNSNLELVGNNGSCVLRVSSDKHSLLLAGDIEKLAEKSMIEYSTDGLKSRVLVAPHHGSRTSSTKSFIASVQPEQVIFAVGYRNRFRFPHKGVMARYSQCGAVLFNVAQTGAITFKFDDKSAILKPFLYREENKRLWHEYE